MDYDCYSKKNVVNTGTTIFAFKYAQGIILCSDGQIGMSTIITNRYAHKIMHVVDNIYVGTSGDSAILQYFVRMLRQTLERKRATEYDIQSNQNRMLASNVANLTYRICSVNRYFVGTEFIICGFNNEDASIYHVAIPELIINKNTICIGSGGDIIRYNLEEFHKVYPVLNEEEAIKQAKKFMINSHETDVLTGSVMRYALIKRDKVEERIEVLE